MEERLAQSAESHLCPGMLADLLSGEIEDDDLRRRVIPHLLARCPACRRRVEGIRRLQERFDHWNESVVVREGQDAPRLLAMLMGVPEEMRLLRLATDEEFHTWGLARLLMQQSREMVHKDPRTAVEMAELAVLAADQLPEEPYHPEWVADLRARGWAVLGNARRVVGELTSSEAAFRRSLAVLDVRSTGRSIVRAEVLTLLVSLRREQGRLPEALDLLDRVEMLHQAAGDRHSVGKTLLKRANLLEEDGRLAEAIEVLHRAETLIDPEREPRLPVCAKQSRVWCLISLKRFEAARELLTELEKSPAWSELHRRRLRWMGAHIAQGLGDWKEAESAFSEAQTWFLDHDLGFDAAVVSLDLAVLYAETGRDQELRELSSRILPLFRARGVGREAMAALLLFRQALERKSLSAELLRQVREIARRRGRRNRRSPAEIELLRRPE